MRALIVSDDETTQRHLTALLSPAGHEAAPAPSADQARHLLTQADFSVIFVEMARLTLPEIQLLGAARAHRNFQPYCILLTGPADSAQIISGLNAGADDFLNRDCSAAELQARLRVAERSLQLQQSLANTHQRLRHELESAAQVQRAHLPPRAPRFGKSSLAWAYVPCEAVGGDFLNAFHLDREQVGMYMLDVSGHGVSSALMSLAINQSLSATPNETNVVNRPIRSSGRGVTAIHSTPPAQVVERVNVRFPADKETGKFFTLLYGIVDLSKGVFRFTSAGHPEPILQRAFGEPEIVPVPTNLPIGMASMEGYN